MEIKRIKGNNPRAVRLHHPSYKNCVFTIAEARLYDVPFDCPTCGIQHIYKTHHIVLDENGNSVVHEGIYELLKREGIVGDLQAKKEVTPRPINIGMGYSPDVPIVVSDQNGPVKLPGMNGHQRV